MNDEIGKSFSFDCHLTDFLFPGFDTDSYTGLLAVSCGTAILVLIFEYLKTSRVIKRLRSSVTFGRPSLFKLAFSKSTERSNLIERQETGRCRQYREIWRISDIFGHFLEVTIGYLVMMIAMTYNGYLLIAICIGGLFGYMLYGSVLLNIAAQIVVQRIMCIGCEIKSDGDLVPIIENENEQEGSSGTHRNSENLEPQTTVTVQIHSPS